MGYIPEPLTAAAMAPNLSVSQIAARVPMVSVDEGARCLISRAFMIAHVLEMAFFLSRDVETPAHLYTYYPPPPPTSDNCASLREQRTYLFSASPGKCTVIVNLMSTDVLDFGFYK